MASPARIVFPCDGKVPQAAIFLRCQASHVFTAPALSSAGPSTTDGVGHVFGPCPKCPLTSVYPHATANRNCPFCTYEMVMCSNGTRACRNQVCWFAHTVAENGTIKAPDVWPKLYREQGNYILYSNEQQTTRFDTAIRSLPLEDIEAAMTLVEMSRGRMNDG
ncbi:hypothetical protein GE09DRAFT_1104585, partial [Coniochaeta sp. 2T2.1]